jgi:hypothetical protein
MILQKVKLFLYLTKHHTMQTYWGSEGTVHTFLTLALDGGQLLALVILPLREESQVPIVEEAE